MGFEEALAAVKQGKAVRREGWGRGIMWRKEGMLFPFDDRGPRANALPTLKVDIFGEDWQIVSNEGDQHGGT